MSVITTSEEFDLLQYTLADLMEKAEEDTLLESRTIPEADTDVYPAVFIPHLHADRFQRLIMEASTDIYKFVDIHAVADDGLSFVSDEYADTLTFKIKKNTFDLNVLKQLDLVIEQALLNYFYSFWFAMIPQRPDIAQRYAQVYQSHRNKAHRYTLHKKQAKKTYRAY